MESHFEDMDRTFLPHQAMLVLMAPEEGVEAGLELIARLSVTQIDRLRPGLLPLKPVVVSWSPQSTAVLQDHSDQVVVDLLPPLVQASDLSHLGLCPP